jgi:hypothetical protein
MKNIFRYTFLFIIMLMGAMDMAAQADTTINYNFEVSGNRRLFLRDANKISIWPQTKDSVVQMTKIQYTTLPTPKAITIEPLPIPAAKINVDEKLGYLYRGYIKAGYGTYNTIPVDFYFTDGRSKKGTYGIHYQLLRFIYQYTRSIFASYFGPILRCIPSLYVWLLSLEKFHG